ncbi:MAG: preprotein translocase subunit SecA [Nanoarchaeota archaeon]|nr:preprotein translocase subunit SecA [Nanoarchaeota archaeon]
MKSFIKKLIEGDPVKKYWKRVLEINSKEKEFESLGKEELLEHSKELREKVGKGMPLEQVLPDAFALVREAAKRTLKQRHYDVQLLGGMVIHEGRVAEMLTGEGKTLVATLPVYLNALSGKGAHVITVNDYLARRDAIWMGQIYHALGMKTACIVHDAAYMYDPEFLATNEPKGEGSELDKKRDEVGSFHIIEKFLRPVSRKDAYDAEITYGTNHEFGFDFLRDNITLDRKHRTQREYNYAIIDEVDSILIDEARTPLIISAPDAESSEYYKTFARLVEKLNNEEDYTFEEKTKTVSIQEPGIDKVEKLLNIENIFAPANSRLVHFFQESLKAKSLYLKDRDYVVHNGEIILVDQFTGRMLHGRRYSGGLHQAIEAKENVRVREENRTYATITIQNYFRLYKKIAGMTGTAETSSEEFFKVYGLEVVSIPPNKPVVRKDMSDMIYKMRTAKYKAIAEDVKKRSEAGQPVLLGTTSIEMNEVLSTFLRKEGVAHEILNAKNHEREGEIIAQAGRPGAVTVATNMAGRGVDIVLGGNPGTPEDKKKVLGAGGLHVIGTERHEARRIDNQLRGRSGRQGDPGSSQFYLSLEDDLMRIFGGDRLINLMNTLKVPDDQPIESGMVSKAINQAQSRVEGNNFDIRKHLLDYDDVLTRQRTAIYAKREKCLKAGDGNTILPLAKEFAESAIRDGEMIIEQMKTAGEEGEKIEHHKKQLEEAKRRFEHFPEAIEEERARAIAQSIVRVIDSLWVDHLEALESLRESVGIRAYGHREPLIEYRKEAHILYQAMQKNFEHLGGSIVFQLISADLRRTKPIEEKPRLATPAGKDKVGRNDPCPCGSGKKYKKCHG